MDDSQVVDTQQPRSSPDHLSSVDGDGDHDDGYGNLGTENQIQASMDLGNSQMRSVNHQTILNFNPDDGFDPQLMPPPERPNNRGQQLNGLGNKINGTTEGNLDRSNHKTTRDPEAIEIDEHAIEQISMKDPSKALPSFDWEGLARSYDQVIQEIDQDYLKLQQEDKALQDVFYDIWCEVGSMRESERARKRHKTQRYLVNLEEQKIDAARVHYNQVVEAFDNAYNMLK